MRGHGTEWDVQLLERAKQLDAWLRSHWPYRLPDDTVRSLAIWLERGLTEADIWLFAGIAREQRRRNYWKYLCGICWRALQERGVGRIVDPLLPVTWTFELPPDAAGAWPALISELEDAGLIERCTTCSLQAAGTVYHDRPPHTRADVELYLMRAEA